MSEENLKKDIYYFLGLDEEQLKNIEPLKLYSRHAERMKRSSMLFN